MNSSTKDFWFLFFSRFIKQEFFRPWYSLEDHFFLSLWKWRCQILVFPILFFIRLTRCPIRAPKVSIQSRTDCWKTTGSLEKKNWYMQNNLKTGMHMHSYLQMRIRLQVFWSIVTITCFSNMICLISACNFFWHRRAIDATMQRFIFYFFSRSYKFRIAS